MDDGIMDLKDILEFDKGQEGDCLLESDNFVTLIDETTKMVRETRVELPVVAVKLRSMNNLIAIHHEKQRRALQKQNDNNSRPKLTYDLYKDNSLFVEPMVAIREQQTKIQEYLKTKSTSDPNVLEEASQNEDTPPLSSSDFFESDGCFDSSTPIENNPTANRLETPFQRIVSSTDEDIAAFDIESPVRNGNEDDILYDPEPKRSKFVDDEASDEDETGDTLDPTHEQLKDLYSVCEIIDDNEVNENRGEVVKLFNKQYLDDDQRQTEQILNKMGRINRDVKLEGIPQTETSRNCNKSYRIQKNSIFVDTLPDSFESEDENEMLDLSMDLENNRSTINMECKESVQSFNNSPVMMKNDFLSTFGSFQTSNDMMTTFLKRPQQLASILEMPSFDSKNPTVFKTSK